MSATSEVGAVKTQDHVHDHVFLGASHDSSARRTLWVVALTSVMMVGEIIAGYITGSMALLADGFHMATHAGALSISAIAYAYARRHAHDARYSFGTGKVGDLAGFASALVLAVIAFAIGVQSATRLIDPVLVAFGDATVVAIVGLAVNILSAILLAGSHGHDHAHHDAHGPDHAHGHGKDNNLRAAYFHVLADALTSILAIVALLAGRFLGWVWLDPVMGIVGSVVIARWAWVLMRDTAVVLLDRTDEHVVVEVREAIESLRDVRVTDLHVWRLGPDAHAAIISYSSDDPEIGGTEIRRLLVPIHELRHITIERH